MRTSINSSRLIPRFSAPARCPFNSSIRPSAASCATVQRLRLRRSSWGRDQNCYPGQSRQEAHWHQRDPGVVPNLLMTGGGSPCGIIVYEGDLLPRASW